MDSEFQKHGRESVGWHRGSGTVAAEVIETAADDGPDRRGEAEMAVETQVAGGTAATVVGRKAASMRVVRGADEP